MTHHSFKVGNFDCTVLLDHETIFGPERLTRAFPQATEAEYRQAYAELGVSIDEAKFCSNILFVKTPQEAVLVDTGEAGNPRGGQLLESMKQANIDPASITLVIITHAHRDHVNGVLNDADQPAFPNARYVISKQELAYWEQLMGQDLVGRAEILSTMQAKGLKLIESDEQIVSGITALPIPGHTPGQIGLLIESENNSLLHLADSLHTHMQFAHPEWSPSADADTDVSVPTRRKMLKHAADNHIPVLFYHLPFPGLGMITQEDATCIWNPLD